MKGIIGEVIQFAGDKCPVDWHWCDGKNLSIADYMSLYSVIGTKYGGDGIATFMIPNMLPENEFWDPKQPRWAICLNGDYPNYS